MKNVGFFIKASLILIMVVSILKPQTHIVRAEDPNPPPAGETTDGSSPSTDTSSGDSSAASDSSQASEDESKPAESSTSANDVTFNDVPSNDVPSTDVASNVAASSPSDSTTSTDTAVADTAGAAPAADEAAANSENSAPVPDESASVSSDPSAAPIDSTADPAASASSTEGVESASPVADTFMEAIEKDITLVDGEGQTLTIADVEAQQLLTSSSSDPWFDAGSGVIVGYTSGSGCASFITVCHDGVTNSIQSAIDDPLSSGKQINIEAGDYTAEEFTLNDATRNFSLASNVLVNTINLNTNYSAVSVIGAIFTALNVNLNFSGTQTATIQQGVNLTESGGTLNVASKTYNESVTIDNTKDGITIAGSGSPTLDGTGLGANNGLNVHAKDVTISGFTVQNFSSGKGISADSGGNFTAHDNKFYRNNTGVALTNGTAGVLSNNTFGDAVEQPKYNFIGIDVDGSGGVPTSGYMLTSTGDKFYDSIEGVLLENGASGYFSGDEFLHNTLGIQVDEGGSIFSQNTLYSHNSIASHFYKAFGTFTNDTFQNNYDGIQATGASVDVSGSTFTDNKHGISAFDTVKNEPSTLVSHNNTYRGNEFAGIALFDNSTATIVNDNFEANGVGVDIDNHSTATITYSNFEGNDAGISSGYPAGTEAHYNRFYNNGVGIQNTNGGADYIQADDNWWGDNQGGSVPGRTAGNVDFSEWLYLDMTPSKDPITTGGDTTQLTTQMVSTDGTSNTLLTNPDLLGIQSSWFKYSSNVTLNTPGMGTLSGDTFTSESQAGDAGFSDTQFDDQTPTTKVTIITARALALNPAGANAPGNPDAPAPPAPIQQAVIPVTGDGLVNLLCGGASQLTLANGNTVRIPSLTPCTMQASLQSEAVEALPGPLPDGVQFVDALAVSVVDGGNALENLPQESLIQVNFAAPQIQAANSLAVYWWNGNAWQEVPANNLGVTETNSTGVFVLVMK